MVDPKGGGRLGGLQPSYKYDLFIRLGLSNLKFLLISNFNLISLLFTPAFIRNPPLVLSNPIVLNFT